jgi:hypothetical protein
MTDVAVLRFAPGNSNITAGVAGLTVLFAISHISTEKYASSELLDDPALNEEGGRNNTHMRYYRSRVRQSQSSHRPKHTQHNEIFLQILLTILKILLALLLLVLLLLVTKADLPSTPVEWIKLVVHALLGH